MSRSADWLIPTLATKSHYDVLGVSRQATQHEIRDAYRSLARNLHPDVADVDARTSLTMAEVNRAWSVLSDPRKRREYDRALAGPVAHSEGRGAEERETFFRAPTTVTPPRIPWRGALFFAILGIVVVLVLAAFVDPEEPLKPDRLLTSGSCVDIDTTLAVREVDCSGPHDAVVRQLIAFDAVCPNGTEAYRDSQGMGNACVDRVVTTTP